MSNSRVAAIVVAAMVFVAPGAAISQEGCRMNQLASVDMEANEWGVPTIPVRINGSDETFFVGLASRNMPALIKQEASNRLHLPGAYIEDSVYAAGKGMNRSSVVDTFDIGDAKQRDLRLFVADDQLFPQEVAGVIFLSALKNVDDEFDFRAGKLSLYSTQGCKDEVVRWTKGAVVALPFARSLIKGIAVQAVLDGKKMTVQIEPALSTSVLSLDRAKSLFGPGTIGSGISKVPPPSHPSFLEVGIGELYSYPFKTLSMDGLEVRNPQILLMEQWDDELTLGISILRNVHMYVAQQQKLIYLTAADAH